MMEFFLLKLAEHIKNPIQPKLVSAKGPILQFDEMDPVNAGYFVNKSVEFTDLLMSPYPMVNLSMKELIVEKEPSVTTKALQLFSYDEEHIPALYFMLNPIRVDCLAKSVRINPNGTVDKVILDRDKLPDYKVFMPAGIEERKIILSKDVAEQLLYEGFYGLGLEKVEVM